MRLLVPSLKKPRTHFTSHKRIHKSILYCYAYISTWKTIFCILIEFIFYGKLSLPSAWLFRAVFEWFFLGCWRVRPIEKLVRTGSSRLQASQFLRTIDYNQFSKEIEEKILCIIYRHENVRLLWYADYVERHISIATRGTIKWIEMLSKLQK